MHADAEATPLEALARDAPAVCVLAGTSHALAPALADVCAHTPAGVPIVVACDAAGADAAGAAVAAVASGRGVRILPGDVADAAAALHPADVVVCDGRHRVGPHWLEGLRGAVDADATIATASALTSAGGETAIGAPGAGDDAAEALRGRALRIRPRLERPAGECVYVRRSALELAGPLDGGFAGRCTALGLLHVAADDVLVRTPPGAGGDTPGPAAGVPMEVIALRRAAHRPH